MEGIARFEFMPHWLVRYILMLPYCTIALPTGHCYVCLSKKWANNHFILHIIITCVMGLSMPNVNRLEEHYHISSLSVQTLK